MAMASSSPTPIGWPVKPFTLVMTMSSALSENVLRRAMTSAAALPPRAGVYVSCDMKIMLGARSRRSRPWRDSQEPTSFSITPEMCSTSKREPWNALLATSTPNTSAIPPAPRLAAAPCSSTTMPTAPMPTIMP